MRRRHKSGFTLIELMVTLLVGAILVGLAAPSFRDLMVKSRLRGATDDIVNLLNQARGSAVKLQRDVNVSADTANWCVGASAAGDPASVGDAVPAAAKCDCTASVVTCLVASQNALVTGTNYSGVSITNDAANSINNSVGGITFNAKFGALTLGAVPASPAIQVSVADGKYTTQISVSQLGETRVCTPSTSGFVSGYPTC